jgi:hypothetical protein
MGDWENGPHALNHAGPIDRINELPHSGDTQQCKTQPDQPMVVSRGQAGKIYEVQIWCSERRRVRRHRLIRITCFRPHHAQRRRGPDGRGQCATTWHNQDQHIPRREPLTQSTPAILPFSHSHIFRWSLTISQYLSNILDITPL